MNYTIQKSLFIDGLHNLEKTKLKFMYLWTAGQKYRGGGRKSPCLGIRFGSAIWDYSLQAIASAPHQF